MKVSFRQKKTRAPFNRSVVPLPPKTAHGLGRPPILTDEIIEEFAQVLPVVAYLETVGDLLGICTRTWKTWNTNGKAELLRLSQDPTAVLDPTKELYLKFHLMFKRSLAQSSLRNIRNIVSKSDQQWQAAAWLEERRHPELWGDQRREIAEIKRDIAEMKKEAQGLKSIPAHVISPLTTRDDRVLNKVQ